jgi:hypothetical protein
MMRIEQPVLRPGKLVARLVVSIEQPVVKLAGWIVMLADLLPVSPGTHFDPPGSNHLRLVVLVWHFEHEALVASL